MACPASWAAAAIRRPRCGASASPNAGCRWTSRNPAIDMRLHIRKWYLQIEDTLANETGREADGNPLRKIVIAAAIRNPHAGTTFVDDLSDIVSASKALGEAFGRRAVAAADGARI